MCGEPDELVKTFTSWQVLGCWQVLDGVGGVWACGAGGYTAVRMTAVRRPETGRYSQEKITAVSGALCFCENNGISAGQRRYFYFRITIFGK